MNLKEYKVCFRNNQDGSIRLILAESKTKAIEEFARQNEVNVSSYIKVLR